MPDAAAKSTSSGRPGLLNIPDAVLFILIENLTIKGGPPSLYLEVRPAS